MSNPQVEAVVAGSKGFAVALLAPLTERVGVRPRIAADAAQALGLVQGPNGLAVLEVLGDGTVAAIESLLGGRNGLRVIAAVPDALAGYGDRLRALGVELARWDGKVDGVLATLARGAEQTSPANPPPAAPAAGAAAPLASSPTGAPRSPAHGAAPAGPAARPPAGAAPRAPAASPVRAPPAAAPRPAVAAGAPSSARLAAAPAAAPRAAVPRPTSIASIADVTPVRDLEEPDVDLGGLGLPTPVPAATARAPAPARTAAPRPSAVPPPADPQSTPGAWPGGGPTSSQAEDALAVALAGMVDRGTSLGPIAEQVAAAVSDLERAVLSGEPIPLDAEPFRRSARIRVQVAAALAAVPPPGSAVDGAALSGILGEIDALLSEVGVLALSVPPELTPSLEAVRNGLVKEAIDLSEAAQRVGSAEPLPATARAPGRRAAATRVISVERGDGAEPQARTPRWQIALLVAVLAVAAAYHGWRWNERRMIAPQEISFAGAPENTIGVERGRTRLLLVVPGKTVNPDELQRYRTEQEALGNVVREIAPGKWVIEAPQGAGRQ